MLDKRELAIPVFVETYLRFKLRVEQVNIKGIGFNVFSDYLIAANGKIFFYAQSKAMAVHSSVDINIDACRCRRYRSTSS